MEFMKNPVWQLVSTIAAIVSIIVAWFIYIDTKPIKNLNVEILTNSHLISIDAGIAKEIQVFYNGSAVDSLSLILLKFENTGNEPIRETDYSQPIQIVLSKNAEIGEASIQETHPDGIQLAPSVIGKNIIHLDKILLNPGDQVILKILAINNDNTLNISARIAGISNIEISSALESDTSMRKSSLTPLIVAAIFYALLLIVVLLWNSRRVMIWRKENLGFDPARNYYIEAQNKMSRGAPTLDRLSAVALLLRNSFHWDSSYLEKAQKDSIFSELREHEIFENLVNEFDNKKTTSRKNTYSKKPQQDS